MRRWLLQAAVTLLASLTAAMASILYYNGTSWVTTDDLSVAQPMALQAATKTFTFTGAAGKGAVGATDAIFTVTGQVEIVRICGYCTVSLVSAGGGTLSLGAVGATGLFISTTTAAAIATATPWWATTTPAAGGRNLPAGTLQSVVDGNVRMVVATADVTAGAIRFDVLWRPISSGASLVAA